MDETGRRSNDIWLVVIGFLHPILSLGLLIGSGLKPLGADPFVYSAVSTVLPVAAVLGAAQSEARFSRSGLAGFVVWMAAVGFAHLWVLFTTFANV